MDAEFPLYKELCFRMLDQADYEYMDGHIWIAHL